MPLEKISIIIPVHNERATLMQMVNKVRNSNTLGLEKEIILIDDYSSDGSREISLPSDITSLKHDKNRGKGACVKTGFASSKGDIVLIQDADTEYSPKDYPSLLAPLISGEADVVLGVRTWSLKLKALPFYFYNKASALILSLVVGVQISDPYVCYKVFNRRAANSCLRGLKENGFGVETELCSTIAREVRKGNLVLSQVSISYVPRTYAQGKKIRLRDALSLILTVRR